MTLYEKVMFYWLHDQRKHDLGENFATKRVNALTNEELLQAISDALEELKNDSRVN